MGFIFGKDKYGGLYDLYKKMGIKNSEDLIELVTDRPGHDKRYAIDSTKIHNQLYWSSKTNFLDGLELTIDWYLEKLIKKPR